MATNTGGCQTASRAYYAYGTTRAGDPAALSTDRTFTNDYSGWGQERIPCGMTIRSCLNPL